MSRSAYHERGKHESLRDDLAARLEIHGYACAACIAGDECRAAGAILARWGV